MRLDGGGGGGAACSNSLPQPGVKTFGGLGGGGGLVVSSAAGLPRGCRWVTQHRKLKMIPVTRSLF